MGGHKLDKFIGRIHSVLIPVLIQGDNDMAGGEVGGGILAHLRNRGGSPVQLGIFVWDIAGLHAVADIHGDHLIGKGPGEELILPRSTPDTLIHVILPHLKHLQGNVAVLGGKVQIAVLVSVAAAVLEQQGHKAACQVVPAKGGRAGNVSDGAAGFHQLVPGGGNTESVLGKKRLVVIEHLGVGVDRQGIDTLLGIAGVRLPQPFKDVLVVGHAHIGICNIGLQVNHIVGLEVVGHIGAQGQGHIRGAARLDRAHHAGIELTAAAVKGGDHGNTLLGTYRFIELLHQPFQNLQVVLIGDGVPELEFHRAGKGTQFPGGGFGPAGGRFAAAGRQGKAQGQGKAYADELPFHRKFLLLFFRAICFHCVIQSPAGRAGS